MSYNQDPFTKLQAAQPVQSKSGKYLQLTPACDVKIVAPKYLDTPTLPLDMLTLISGRAGTGKSTFALHKLAQATTGTLNGDYKGKPINVAIFAREDTLGMQCARLKAAGADMNRVFFDESYFLTKNHEGIEEHVDTVTSIPEDLEALETVLASHDIKLALVDPLNSYMDGDTNRKDDVRKALDPLARMAQRLNTSIIGILHLNKGGGYASDKISGSHAFRDVARSVLLVAKDDETGKCFITLDKCQYSQEQGASWTFQLESVEIPTDDNTTMSVAKISNLETSETSAGEIINANQMRDIDAATSARLEDSTSDVLAFIIDLLEGNGGKLETKEIKKEALAAGYTWAQCTNVRSRHKGKIKSTQVKQYVYVWELIKDTTTEQNTFSTLITNDKREPNDSNTLSTLITSPTEEEKRNTRTQVRSVRSVINVNDSNTSHLSQAINVNNDDALSSLKGLPQYPAKDDFKDLTTSQLDYLISHRSGLWVKYASEEKALREAQNNTK
ncbi:AAA family ATPase [Gardnerella vaginalis]|uniref:AAA family ATPase n=1 Tax=Gardnerella vaginalis TaxID=2702 RepID=UPI0039F0CF22